MNAATKPEAPAISNAVTTTTAIAKPPVRVLKIATCPSLSGKSTLTYHIGCEVDPAGICTDELRFRIVANTNIGFFSQEWVAMSVIQREFDKVPAGKTITSFQLHPLFRGKSVNTPAFLFAVLMNEGLVQHANDSQRRYERLDPAGFLSAIKALIASSVDLKVADISKRKSVKAKPATVDAKDSPSKIDASPSKTGAKPSAKPAKLGAKSAKGDANAAKGVDIAAIVDVPQFWSPNLSSQETLNPSKVRITHGPPPPRIHPGCHSWTVAGFPLPEIARPWTAHWGDLWGRYCRSWGGYGGLRVGIGAAGLSGGESLFAHVRVALRGGHGGFVVGAMQVQAAPQTQWRVAPGSSS